MQKRVARLQFPESNYPMAACVFLVGRADFLKTLSVDFTIQYWHMCNFLKNKKSKESLNFCFYHHQVFPKPPKGNKKLQTRAIYHKGVCKPDKLFKTTATSTLNFHRCWIIKWTYVAKVGCPFHTYWMLPLNSKICSAKYFETQNQHLEYFLKKIIHRG